MGYAMYKKTLAMLMFVSSPLAYGAEMAQIVPSDWQVEQTAKQVVVTTPQKISYHFDALDAKQSDGEWLIHATNIKVNADANKIPPYLVRWLEWLQDIEGIQVDATMRYTESANDIIVNIHYDNHLVAEIQLIGEPVVLDMVNPQNAFSEFFNTQTHLKMKADIADWFKRALNAKGVDLPTLKKLTLLWDNGDEHPSMSLSGECDGNASCVNLQFLLSNPSLDNVTYGDYILTSKQEYSDKHPSDFKIDDIKLNIDIPMQLSSDLLASIFGEIGQYIHNQDDGLDGQFTAKLINEDKSLLLNIGYYPENYSNFELSILMASFSNNLVGNLNQAFIDGVTFKVDGSQAMNSLITQVTDIPSQYQQSARKTLSKGYVNQAMNEGGALSKAYNYAMSRYVLDPQSINIDLSAEHTVTVGDFASFVYGYYLAGQPQQMLLDWVQKNYTYKFIVNGDSVEAPNR